MTSYYKLRGMDALLTGVYDTWISTELDTDASDYHGALATPLRDVIVVDSWSEPPATPGPGSFGYYVKPPRSPNAYNFEASTAVSADLAANGFTFRRFTAPAGTMVRVGEIYAYRGVGTFTPLGALEYRSSLIDGRLFLQLPKNAADINYTLTKPATVPATTTNHGGLLWARAQPAFAYAPPGAGATFLNYLAAAWLIGAAGFPSTTGWHGTAYYSVAHAWKSADSSAGSGSPTDMGNAGAAFEDIKLLRIRATTPNVSVSQSFASTFTGGFSHLVHTTSTLAAANFAHAGLLLRPGDNGALQDSLPWDYCIDFIRLYQGDLSGIWIGGL